jgi:hypothetical protein
MRAAVQETASPYVRFAAVWRSSKLCWDSYSLAIQNPLMKLMQVYRTALPLIPQVVWLGNDIHHRYNDLSRLDLGNIATAAAAIAIATGQRHLAIEWLEAGRTVVWRQLFQLRTPVEELREHSPKLAGRLHNISHSLASVDYGYLSHLSRAVPLSPEETGVSRRKLAEDYKTLLVDIRKEPGFERFLLPKTLAELAPACRNGPVAIIIIHHSRCDALVLCSPEKVVHVHLEHFSFKLAENMRSLLAKSIFGREARYRDGRGILTAGVNDGMRRVLRVLWLRVVQPVLCSIEDEVSKT